MAKAKRMPQEILVYVCDTLEDGTPVYGVAHNVEEIPEENDGEKVGIYVLNRADNFRVRRELK